MSLTAKNGVLEAPWMSRGAALRALSTGRTARAGFWAIVDQSMISGTNFLTGLILARYCEPTEYGSYALAFSILLFFSAVQNTLITGPMMVLGPARAAESFRRYITSLAVVQALLSTLLALTTLLVAGSLQFSPRNSALVGSLAGMGAAVFFVQAQEFCRRVLFVKLRTSQLLRNDLVYCGFQIVALVALWRIGAGATVSSGPGWLSPRNVFLSLSLAGFVALAVGLVQIRSYLSKSSSVAADCLRENWAFAKWGWGSLLGEFLYVQGTLSVVTVLAGAAGTAVVEAPRLILAPLNILHFGGMSVITARAAEKYGEGGEKALASFLQRIAVVWAIPFVAYPAVIGLAPEFWLGLVYGGKYADAGSALLLWAVAHSLVGLRILPWIAITVLRRPDIHMYASLVVGVLVVGLSLGLTPLLGPSGAVGARVAGDIVLLAVGAWAAARLLRKSRNVEPV